jgi:hypothetical protein
MRRRTSKNQLVLWKSPGFLPHLRQACSIRSNRAGRKARTVLATPDVAMKTAMILQRLPGPEKSCRREGAAFGALAFAGFTAIWFALSVLNSFVVTRDDVIATFTSRPKGTRLRDVKLMNSTSGKKKNAAEVRAGKTSRIPTT